LKIKNPDKEVYFDSKIVELKARLSAWSIIMLNLPIGRQARFQHLYYLK
jgi:hypothetical protein